MERVCLGRHCTYSGEPSLRKKVASHPPIIAAIHAANKPLPEGVKYAWKPILCSGYDVAPDGTREYHQFKYPGNKQCDCKPSPHYLAYISTAYEIGCGGGRGSGKSELGFGMSMRGNKGIPDSEKTPTDITYTNNPNFRGLILRKNSVDLADWVSRARQFYRPFGAEVTENPVRVRFPSGAEFVASHLKDDDAFSKYQGQQFQFLWVEELNQIPDELTYEKVRMSIRSTIPGVTARIFVTFNPGGPGHTWTRNRFVYPKYRDQIVPWGMKFTPEGLKPTQSRVFFHSTVDDNPYFLVNEGAYIDNLDSLKNLSMAQYRRWRLGDFDAVEGQYFEAYRDKRIEGEPEHACHVVSEANYQLQPWWPIHVAMDWGFKHNAALIKGVVCPNSQFVIKDEIVASGIASQDWGVRIAEWCMGDLRRQNNHTINLWLSPDAFGKRDDMNTVSQQIQRGVDMVLGKGSAFILGDNAEEYFEGMSFQEGKARIIIRRAQNQRIFGWQEMRAMMRWHSLKPNKTQEYNHDYATKLLLEHGTSRYLEYRAQFEKRKVEVLPKLLIYDNCKFVRQSIPMAVHDSDHEGREEDVLKTPTLYDDVLDCLRYLCMGYKYHVERMPPEDFAHERLESALKHDPYLSPALQFEVKRQAHEQFEDVWGKETTAFSIGRGSSGMGGFWEAKN